MKNNLGPGVRPQIKMGYVVCPGIPYKEGWKRQEEIRDSILEGKGKQILIIVEHPPTISLGKTETGSNMVQTESWLKGHGFDVVQTNRGGKVTYHGPGQLVAYPILHLPSWKLGVKDYVHQLEQVMIETLKHYEIKASRNQNFIGTWVNGKKIGSIGIHVRRSVSIHGLALNVCPNLSHFEMIHPCGLKEVEMTSMKNEGVLVNLKDVIPTFLKAFENIFHCRLEPEIERS